MFVCVCELVIVLVGISLITAKNKWGLCCTRTANKNIKNGVYTLPCLRHVLATRYKDVLRQRVVCIVACSPLPLARSVRAAFCGQCLVLSFKLARFFCQFSLRLTSISLCLSLVGFFLGLLFILSSLILQKDCES